MFSSRYDFAELVSDKLNLDKNLLKPAYMKDMKWTAERPKDLSLDVSNAASILNEKPFSINQGLDQFANEFRLMYK